MYVCVFVRVRARVRVCTCECVTVCVRVYIRVRLRCLPLLVGNGLTHGSSVFGCLKTSVEIKTGKMSEKKEDLHTLYFDDLMRFNL